MTYIYEELDDEGYSKDFKTLAGATSHGCRRQKSHGYFAADRHVPITGRGGWSKHVVAEWKKDGRVVAQVWS